MWTVAEILLGPPVNRVLRTLCGPEFMICWLADEALFREDVSFS